MNAKILAVIIVFITNFQLCQGKRYDRYAMFHVFPMEKEHLKFLKNLEDASYIEVIFWRKPSKLYETVQLIVAPRDEAAFRERCKHFGLDLEKKHPNVQELFDAQKVTQRYVKFQTDSYTWNQYHYLADIQQWMIDIVNKNPTIAELIPIGKSVENRDIYALSIARKNTQGTVIIEAGIHGNEWISTEFVTFLANNLINNVNGSDARLNEVANTFRWYLVPVVNPDGYEYSHSTDRLWRKNRRPFGNATYGVDLNRNFNYSFAKFGTSNHSASDIYCGPNPFSEPETVALLTFIASKAIHLKYYFSFHSYGQKIIIPYGDKILHVDNYGDCENYGKQAIIKIYKKSGLKYGIGTSYDTLGQKVSGDSASWVKEALQVPYVYTFLLRDIGRYGYGMPPSEITPTCEETLTAVLEIMTTRVIKLRADIFSDSAVGDGASWGLLLSVVAFWLAK